VAGVLAGALAFSSPSAAQQAELSGEIRQSDNAARHTQEIATFIDAQLGRMAGGDLVESVRARQALIGPISGEPSDSFEQEYVRLLVERLRPALSAQAPFVRVNSAIAVESIAAATGSPQLVALVESLIRDESPGVSLWGVKSAGSVLPESARQSPQGREPLLPAIVETVRLNPDLGVLADEAYRAMRGRLVGGVEAADEFALNRVANQLTNSALDLMALRQNAYAVPSSSELPRTPPRPLAEQSAILLIVDARVWNRQEAVTRERVATVLRDHAVLLRSAIVAAADAARQLDDEDEQDLARELRNDLTILLKRVSAAFVAISGRESGAQAQALQAAATDLESQPNVLAPQVLEEKVDALLAAVASMYPNIPAPPEVSGRTTGEADTME
jgi:hypothetical protein